eukprot:12185932-Alexandrium_andersonii.AAC.1
MGRDVRIAKPGSPCWVKPVQHPDFGAPERWGLSNPCDSDPTGAGPGGEGGKNSSRFKIPDQADDRAM